MNAELLQISAAQPTQVLLTLLSRRERVGTCIASTSRPAPPRWSRPTPVTLTTGGPPTTWWSARSGPARPDGGLGNPGAGRSRVALADPDPGDRRRHARAARRHRGGRLGALHHQRRSQAGRLVERPISGGPEKVLASHPEVDVESVWVHPLQHAAQGVVFEPGPPTWMVLDPTVKKDFDIFPHLTHGFGRVVSRDAADRTWLVEFSDPRGPTRWFTFDRESLKGTFLFSDRPALESAPLVDVIPVRFTARDGVPLHGYFTRAAGTRGRAPLVVLVHPGPWTRVHPELDPEVQWLANRGYSVVQVNFRGSTGYGRKFLEAGNQPVGEGNAARPARRRGVGGEGWRDGSRTGGDRREELRGLRRAGGRCLHPGDVPVRGGFRRAVQPRGARSGPTPRPGDPFRALLARRLGNVDSPADRAVLEAVSPLLLRRPAPHPPAHRPGRRGPRVVPEEPSGWSPGWSSAGWR